MNTFEHDEGVFVTDWRKAGCVKKFLSGHMAGRWSAYRRTMERVAEAVMSLD
ncbi:MAG: hypothetical protein WA066_01510 [Candidatus Omnitrophota bacterium]